MNTDLLTVGEEEQRHNTEHVLCTHICSYITTETNLTFIFFYSVLYSLLCQNPTCCLRFRSSFISSKQFSVASPPHFDFFWSYLTANNLHSDAERNHLGPCRVYCGYTLLCCIPLNSLKIHK